MDGIIMAKKELKIYRHAMNVIEGKLNISEFSLIIGKSYRQAQRIVKKVREKAELGVLHGNLGKVPINKTDPILIEEVVRLKKDQYKDFNLVHFLEKIKEQEGLEIKYSTLYRAAKKNDLIKYSKRRSKKVHKLRPRLPQEGMLIQFDGSEHIWFGSFKCDLIAGIDDATGKIVAAEFFIGETSLHSMKVIQSIIENHGIPEAFYMDEAAIFGKRDREWKSQISRAFETLDIKLILAGSAQAKGRIERLFRTLQDRLIAELSLVDVKTIVQANQYLQQVFIPEFNKKFAHPPRENVKAYRELKEQNLKNILCRKISRKIAPGNIFSYLNKKYVLQGYKDYRFRKININTHQDGTITYDINGKKVEVEIMKLNKGKMKKAG